MQGRPLNDPTNLGSVHCCCSKSGLDQTLKMALAFSPTVLTVVENRKNLKVIVELVSTAQWPRSLLDDAQIALGSYQYLMPARLAWYSAKDGIFVEDKDSPYCKPDRNA